MIKIEKPISVCHVAVGDTWAGAEVQLKTLLSKLVRYADLRLSVILFNGGRLGQEIAGLGIPITVFPEMEWSSARILIKLIRRFRSVPAHIIHTHKYKDTALAVPAGKICGIPRVVRTIHGLSEPFRGIRAAKMQVYESLEKVVHKTMVDVLIGVSSQIADRYQNESGGPQVVCIKNGIELEGVGREWRRETIRRDLGLAADTCAIGAVGRLTPVKGLQYVIQAVKGLLDRGVKVRLLLIGGGPLHDELEALGKQVGIGPNMTLLGHREDTADLMQALDIFALPSLSEGIPMALLEAMASARPIVASRVGGIPEVIEDGVHGCLVEPADARELADKCLRLIHNPEMARQMGAAARVRVEREFSAKIMAAKVAEIYRNLMTIGSPPR